MSLLNTHLMDISDIYRTYNGHKFGMKELNLVIQTELEFFEIFSFRTECFSIVS
jgi:hypothetical protein